MKHTQKLVLVPIERWQKIGDNIPVKEVSVKTVPQKKIIQERSPVSQGKKVKTQQGSGNRQIPKQTQIFHFLILEKRKKAIKLFKYLIKNKIFKFNKDGELIQNGKTVHESNILELITHAVQNDSSTPKGMKYFYQTLKRKNIPEVYIVNKNGKKIMNTSFLDEASLWRPPGHLNKYFKK